MACLCQNFPNRWMNRVVHLGAHRAGRRSQVDQGLMAYESIISARTTDTPSPEASSPRAIAPSSC